jgi:hypothetical protein
LSSPAIFVYAHLADTGRGLLRSVLAGARMVFADKHRGAEARQEYLDRFRESDICFGNIPADWLPQTARLCTMS